MYYIFYENTFKNDYFYVIVLFLLIKEGYPMLNSIKHRPFKCTYADILLFVSYCVCAKLHV